MKSITKEIGRDEADLTQTALYDSLSGHFDEQIIRLPGVQKLVNLGKTAIYEQIGKGTFPAPFRLGPNSVGWKKSEVVEWINSLKRAR